MTIELTYEEFFVEQFQEANEEELQWDPSDNLDITYKFDAQISQGWRREIDLREELWLMIDRHQSVDQILINFPEEERYSIVSSFLLSGAGETTAKNTSGKMTAGQFYLRTNGIQPLTTGRYSCTEQISFLQVYISPSMLNSFATSPGGELQRNLQHLVKSSTQETYTRSGDTQPQMATVIHQILRCPYQGVIKRAYLESKAIELLALVLEHEVTAQDGEVKQVSLKPEQLERVHYAKEILLRDLSNPPSLEELARQAGLNDFMLRQGFWQVFGTTVFSQLQAHRLAVAKQLLAEQDISVTEVAHRIGYASVPSFTKAFKRTFGITPKTHQKACR